MTFFNLEWLQAGMVVDQPVLDSKGALLLAAGTELSAKHLALLRARGIPGVEIRTPEAETVEETAVSEGATLEQAQERFRHVNIEHPFIAELWRLYQQTNIRKE